MRLLERTLQTVLIHARIRTPGAMGGRARTLSSEGASVRASVLPEGGESRVTQRGEAHANRIRLLVAGDTRVAAGDGAAVNGRMYIVREINRWRAHLELVCEEQTG